MFTHIEKHIEGQVDNIDVFQQTQSYQCLCPRHPYYALNMCFDRMVILKRVILDFV